MLLASALSTIALLITVSTAARRNASDADYTLIDNAFNSQGSVSFAALAANVIAANTEQIAGPSSFSTVAVSADAESRKFAAAVLSPPTADPQELKKRRPSTWEMLES